MTDVVLRDIDDGVALLTLNRPDRLNAWTPAMEQAYFDLLADCGDREDVRAIVVTGAGRGFCAGVDMETLTAVSEAGRDEHAGARPQTFPLSIPKPIVAAINGACAGLGLVQALMCDVRVVSEDAKLTTAFARRGLVAEHGIGWILPRLIGPARALDLLLSGRVILGREAAELGVANWAVAKDDVLDRSIAYARELSVHSSPASMAAMKRQVWMGAEIDLATALADADRRMAAALASPDFAEGVQSFLERRPPQFAPAGRRDE